MIQLAKNLELWPIERLKPYERNARTHSADQIEKISSSIIQFGFNNPILIDAKDGIIAGHGRLAAAKQLGMTEIPVVVLTHLSDAQRRAYILADNKLHELGGWDRGILNEELEALKADDFDMSSIGFSDEELERSMHGFLPDEPMPFADGGFTADLPGSAPAANVNAPQDNTGSVSQAEPPKKLTDQFIVPPFSVLDARQGYWQERKRAWLAMGIKSEVGRGSNLLKMSDTMLEPDPEKRAKLRNIDPGRNSPQPESSIYASYASGSGNAGAMRMDGFDSGGTSIFDPVLCELAYRWFSPAGGVVLDPFAGGSVRGIVASKTGRQYFGCDLRQEQIDANQAQARPICGNAPEEPYPIWKCGDSTEIRTHFKGVHADLIFSCPPYADLEVYSDDPKDISTFEYPEFLAAYKTIIAQSVMMLKPNRFAVFVIGEVRAKDRNGFYRNFVRDTIEAFEAAGAKHYNEMILLTSAGTLALRAGRVFSASRKIGKTHQNVIVFCKGDPWEAVKACGEIEVALPDGMGGPANENGELLSNDSSEVPLSNDSKIGGEL